MRRIVVFLALAACAIAFPARALNEQVGIGQAPDGTIVATLVTWHFTGSGSGNFTASFVISGGVLVSASAWNNPQPVPTLAPLGYIALIALLLISAGSAILRQE